jgi:hypothetical protein
MPISTLPRHDYDEDEYLLKPAGLRDTHSEGKVNMKPKPCRFFFFGTMFLVGQGSFLARTHLECNAIVLCPTSADCLSLRYGR